LRVFLSQADIWSVGVVLFVLLYGLTPWEIARDSSYEYRMYKLSGGYPNMQPWVRIPTAIRTLFHHTMWSRPARRWTTEQLRSYITRDLGWNPSPPKAFMLMMMQKMQKVQAQAQVQPLGDR
jgi:serine/threonine protein kinase